MTGGDYFVYLNEQEAEKICVHLQLSRSWFRRRYLERLEDGELVAASGTDNRCAFLDARGQCKVYPVRPLQCRTYPFWPELVQRKSGWAREAKRCEGINRGTVVPVGKIRRAVNACLDT